MGPELPGGQQLLQAAGSFPCSGTTNVPSHWNGLAANVCGAPVSLQSVPYREGSGLTIKSCPDLNL